MRALFFFGVALLPSILGCGDPAATDASPVDDALHHDAYEDEAEGGSSGPALVTSSLFRFRSVDFELTGSGSLSPPIHIDPPSGYAIHIPILEVREYSAGDDDYAFAFQAGPIGMDLGGHVSHAPSKSDGVPNRVRGRYSLLSLHAVVPAKWSLVETTDGPSKLFPGHTFEGGTYGYLRSLWAMDPGSNDDAEHDSWLEGHSHGFKSWGGDGSSHFETQLVEVGAPAGLEISRVYFDVVSEKPRSYTLPRKPSLHGVVIAAPDSYITCGARRVSWNIECSHSPESSTCTVSVTRGEPSCSRVQGSMVLLQSP